MSTPQKYDPIIAFVEERIESIKRRPLEAIGQYLDRAALLELEGVRTVCQQLNRQEALVHDALFPKAIYSR